MKVKGLNIQIFNAAREWLHGEADLYRGKRGLTDITLAEFIEWIDAIDVSKV